MKRPAAATRPSLPMLASDSPFVRGPPPGDPPRKLHFNVGFVRDPHPLESLTAPEGLVDAVPVNVHVSYQTTNVRVGAPDKLRFDWHVARLVNACGSRVSQHEAFATLVDLADAAPEALERLFAARRRQRAHARAVEVAARRGVEGFT